MASSGVTSPETESPYPKRKDAIPILKAGCPLVIEEYNEKDKEEVTNLFKRGMTDSWVPETNQETRDLMTYYSHFMGQNFDDVPAMLHYANGGRLFVARTRSGNACAYGEIVGMIGVSVSEADLANRRAELVRMSVKKAFRRENVGRLLVNHAIQYMRDELNADLVWLTTLTTMFSAMRFYEAIGFLRDTSFCRQIRSLKPGVADVARFEMSLRGPCDPGE